MISSAASRNFKRCLALHEIALSALGLATIGGLLFFAPLSVCLILEIAVALIVYPAALITVRQKFHLLSERICFVISFLFVVWFYAMVRQIVPALRFSLHDPALIAMDVFIFGQTPAVLCQHFIFSPLTDFLNLNYLSYHLYLIWFVLASVITATNPNRVLKPKLFFGFVVGFAGYLLVPTVGPALAFPRLFSQPLAGGSISRNVSAIVLNGSSHYDVFPSLHVLITCILLQDDWRNLRWRFWMMGLPSLAMFFSTIYLRYHYAVDLIAAILAFLVIQLLPADGKSTNSSLLHGHNV